ncbi:MAG: hypothetical protein KF769_05420 [Parvibaculum sp.]|nr:hypothetical protein [Parvibaculum sp.]
MPDLLQSLLLLQLAALAGIGGVLWRLGSLTAETKDLQRRMKNVERKADGLA